MIQQIQQQQQQKKEELLKQREQEIAQREVDVMQRELILAFLQQTPQQAKPTPKRRKGKFKHKALGKKETSHISSPSGNDNVKTNGKQFIKCSLVINYIFLQTSDTRLQFNPLIVLRD